MARYKVTGRGRFPLSMLRFDESWPASDTDAVTIEQSFETIGRWTVELVTDSRHSPTRGRWDSFNCRIINGEEDLY